MDDTAAVYVHKGFRKLSAYPENVFLRKNVMLPEKKLAEGVSGHIFQHKKISLPLMDHAQQFRNGGVV